MKVWEGKQVIGFLLTWRLLQQHQLQQQTKDKYIVSSCYIGTRSDLTQVMTFNKKSQSSTTKLNQTYSDKFESELWTVTDSFEEQCM